MPYGSDHPSRASRVRAGLVALLLMVSSLAVAASSVSSQGSLSLATAAAWADEAFPLALAERRFSAAGWVGVDNRGDMVVRSFGVETRGGPAVDAERSVFRLQSVTKVFVALTLLELERRGQLRLSDLANQHLKRVQLARMGGRDVRLKDLLQHRTGLDPLAYAFASPAQGSLPLDSAELQRLLPLLTQTPGDIIRYSNAGYSIAGLVIEDVTGLRLDAAMRQLVFQPLGMEHSFVGHPSPRPPHLIRLQGRFPDGTTWEDNDNPGMPLSHPILEASGSMYTTLGDMARFLRWQLAALRGDAAAVARLLGASGVDELRTVRIANHPALDAQGLGYLHREWNGQPTLEKGGAPGFNTRLLLLPEAGVGFFSFYADAVPVPRPEDHVLAAFGAGHFAGPPPVVGFDSRNALLKVLLGDYVRPAPTTAAASLAAFDLEALRGTYWLDQRPRKAPWLVMYLPARKTVDIAADGSLLIDGAPQKPWGMNAWVPAQGPQRPAQVTAFVRDPRSGHPLMVEIDQSFERVVGLDDPVLLERMAICGLLLCMSGLFAGFWRRGLSRWAVPLALAALGLPVLLWLGYAAGLSFENHIMRGQPGRLWALWMAAHGVALAAMAGLLWLARQGRQLNGLRGIGAVTHAALMLAGAALVIICAVALNWIGHVPPL